MFCPLFSERFLKHLETMVIATFFNPDLNFLVGRSGFGRPEDVSDEPLFDVQFEEFHEIDLLNRYRT